MRKQILSLIIIIALLISVPAKVSAASSGSAENTIHSFMKSCRNYNPSKIKSYFAKGVKYSPYDDKYINKVIRMVHQENLGYEIMDSSVNGNSAKIKLRVWYYDMSEEFESTYIDLLKELRKKKKGTLDGSMKRWAKLMKEELEDDDEDDDSHLIPVEYGQEDEDDYYSYAIVTITLVKQGSSWKIKTLPKKARFFIDGGCSYMSEYIKKHPKKYLKYYVYG